MDVRSRLITVAVILLAFAARLNTLGDIPFWYDEGLVGWAARQSFWETARWTAADVHPPLYFWAVTVWRLFVGETEFALRLISVFFGVLSVVAVYKIGERVQGAPLGNLAALFFALSRFHIWWSQELRMYILGSMCMVFSIWLTVRIVHGEPKRGDWIAYVLVSTAGLLSIYLVAFALAFESLYVTIWLAGCYVTRRAKSMPSFPARLIADAWKSTELRTYLRWVGAQVCVVLLFLPWFLLFLNSYRTWSDSTAFDFLLFIQFYTTMLAVGASANIDQWLWATLIVWALLLMGAALATLGVIGKAARRFSPGGAPARAGEASANGGWLVVLLLVLPPLTVYLGTSPRSFFYTPRVEARYLFPFIWSFYIVLGWCVWRIIKAHRWAGVVSAITLIVLFSASNYQYYASRAPNDVYQSLTATLRAHRQPGDGVLLHDDRTWPIFEFYFAAPNKIWKGVPNGARVREGDADRLLSEFWERHEAVWMVWNEDALRIDEDHRLEKWLAERAVFSHEIALGAKRLIFYARTRERAQTANLLASSASPTYKANLFVGSDVVLTGYDQAVQRYRVGDEMILGLYWQSQRNAEAEVIMRNTGGAERGRWRTVITPGASRTLVRYPITTDLPTGDYDIAVVVDGKPTVFARAEVSQPPAVTIASDAVVATPREARFQNGIRLLGYDAPVTRLRAGDNMQLTLYWRTEQSVAQRYKVFVHVLGATWNPRTNNPLWGQRDQEPANGALPTSAWGVGRTVVDSYLFRISPDAPAGRYVIEIGLYHLTTGERLPIVIPDGTADHVNLFEIEVY